MHHALLEIDVYKPREFAELVGVTAPTVVSWLKSGTLKGHKIGARYYILASELDRLRSH
jgi:excisionase family DNA binding protein